MPSIEAYRRTADQIDQLRPAVAELLADADTAGVELPDVFAAAHHQMLLLPGQLRSFADVMEQERQEHHEGTPQ